MRGHLRRKRAEGVEWGQVNPARRRAQRAQDRAKLRDRTPDEVAAARERLRPQGFKPCGRCRELLPLDAFGANRSTPDGLRGICRACDAAPKLLRRALPLWEERGTYACVYCDAPFEHVDHAHPRALGGTDDPTNLVPACAECNLSKNDMPLPVWLAYIGVPLAL